MYLCLCLCVCVCVCVYDPQLKSVVDDKQQQQQPRDSGSITRLASAAQTTISMANSSTTKFDGLDLAAATALRDQKKKELQGMLHGYIRSEPCIA